MVLVDPIPLAALYVNVPTDKNAGMLDETVSSGANIDRNDQTGTCQHPTSFHSLFNSDSNMGSPRTSEGEASSTSTSVEEVAAQKRTDPLRTVSTERKLAIAVDPLAKELSINTTVQGQHELEIDIQDESDALKSISSGDDQFKDTNDEFVNNQSLLEEKRIKEDNNNNSNTNTAATTTTNNLHDYTFKPDIIERDNTKIQIANEQNLIETSSIIETECYLQDLEDENMLLNKMVSRSSGKNRRSTAESSRKNIPFYSSKHSQILPIENLGTAEHAARRNSTMNPSIISLPSQPYTGASRNVPSASHISLPSFIQNDGNMKRSESATNEIKKMRENLLHKREMKRNRKSFVQDDDRVLIGNRVSEGHVNFIIAYNMLTGIRVAVSRCSGIMKPLVPADFRFTKKLAFDYHGNELTPSSQYAFKFKDYCPEVFRELRAKFGLDPADYLVSLTSKYILSELHSPGKSGSFFYYSRDYRYIIKTIHHSEHWHLRKHLQEYHAHVKNNPDTLICQYFGLHRIKMPISFQNKIKHRKIYFIVMNNLFPPHLDMHSTFDLKGSTCGRITKVDQERAKLDPDYRPVLKDLNWLDENININFGPDKKNKFLDQLRKDVQLLAKLNTMDYSLLIGIHDMNKSKEEEDGAIEENPSEEESADRNNNEVLTGETCEFSSLAGLNRNNTVVPHFFKQSEGGIRASDQFNADTNVIYYIGIIDCLTNYSIIKRLETFWRGLSHDLKAVSAVPPKDYSDRFYKFIEKSVDSKPPQEYTDNPNSKRYKD